MEAGHRQHQATDFSLPFQVQGTSADPYPMTQIHSANQPPSSGAMASPTKGNKKTVTFELHFEGAPDYKGRLPLRVGISPHDATESIIAVVKNFYGIYSNAVSGISFEDKESGSVLIPHFDNFDADMFVVVKILPVAPQGKNLQTIFGQPSGSAHQETGLDGTAQALPSLPSQILQHVPSRPSSRLARRQSASPKLGAALSVSKSRSRNGTRNPKASFQDGLDELDDAHNGYSSGDNAPGSVSSSRLGASADISLENIVEGGRRNYANFESSQLPLFAPPQVPAVNSISSVSPQRRSAGQDNPSPFDKSNQKTFTWTQPLPSPQSYTFEQQQATSPAAGGFQIPAVPKHGRSLRDRHSGASINTNRSSLGAGGGRRSGYGILPTPDPTVASTISDEDVALQLMRLSDMSNFSHGRTSASALDDAFSGRADAASSASDDEDEQSLPTVHPTTETPTAPKRKNAVHELPSYDSIEHTGDEADGDYENGIFKSEIEEDDMPRAKMAKTKLSARARSATKSRSGKPVNVRTGSTSTTMTAPNSVRKTSSASTLTFAHQPGADEDDLSSKPRCQRCRKSKKGCDRQRPCGRCKDAGIGIDGCISEDEGNGRKGRYGRHMGVPVKKTSTGSTAGSKTESPPAQTPDAEITAASAVLHGMGSPDDGAAKKRKRV